MEDKAIAKVAGNISQIAASYTARETTRREYASELCEILSHLQVTAVQLFCPIGRGEDRNALVTEMQKCNIEIEEKLSQARPYLTKKEISAVEKFRDRTFYNYRIWEGIEAKVIKLHTIECYPDDDQAKGIAKHMYDKAQKYLSSNGPSRVWLRVASYIF